MHIRNVTLDDDSLYGVLGSYECHAFAEGDVNERARHGFSVSVIRGKLCTSYKKRSFDARRLIKCHSTDLIQLTTRGIGTSGQQYPFDCLLGAWITAWELMAGLRNCKPLDRYTV